jgi:hypothetical protein
VANQGVWLFRGGKLVSDGGLSPLSPALSTLKIFDSYFALMASSISYSGTNSGLQAGIIHGPVHAEFHFPPGKLQWDRALSAANDAPPKNDQKLHQSPYQIYLSVAM